MGEGSDWPKTKDADAAQDRLARDQDHDLDQDHDADLARAQGIIVVLKPDHGTVGGGSLQTFFTFMFIRSIFL